MKDAFVLVRCRDAGVHCGTLVSHSGREVTLRNSRRLWYWQVPKDKPSFLSGVAIFGIDQKTSKIGTPIDVMLTEVCEIITCTEDAERSIMTAPEVNRDE